ncbi:MULTISPECIES: cytochrome c [unclassified Halomonas]|uniref:cytochrome c n=1 Tax=unclassified Halomonas TaxID=2609666 RepID=UPI000556A3D0|nr:MULTISPECIES: cytochrome c [unclassified Halomonas]CEP36177.1 Cytochrome c/b562 [Halomonas sp. R57-5]
MQQRHRLKRASGHAAVGSALALLICTPLAWAGEELNALAMPQAVSDTPFASEREAVIWRREELKDIESLVRQLRFDLVNNQDFEVATPRLMELQERASAEHLLPAFINGTHGSGSEARASIWEEWDQFAAGFTDLEDKIANLIDVAEQQNPRDTASALSEVGASCKSCHRTYRYD